MEVKVDVTARTFEIFRNKNFGVKPCAIVVGSPLCRTLPKQIRLGSAVFIGRRQVSEALTEAPVRDPRRLRKPYSVDLEESPNFAQ